MNQSSGGSKKAHFEKGGSLAQSAQSEAEDFKNYISY
jgi:hypothetical protein